MDQDVTEEDIDLLEQADAAEDKDKVLVTWGLFTLVSNTQVLEESWSWTIFLVVVCFLFTRHLH